MQALHTCRRNQELEEDSVAMREEKEQLETEAQAMAERLHAVVQDKFEPAKLQFDADTPIDKALSFLQTCIKVRKAASGCFTHPFRFVARIRFTWHSIDTCASVVHAICGVQRPLLVSDSRKQEVVLLCMQIRVNPKSYLVKSASITVCPVNVHAVLLKCSSCPSTPNSSSNMQSKHHLFRSGILYVLVSAQMPPLLYNAAQ